MMTINKNKNKNKKMTEASALVRLLQATSMKIKYHLKFKYRRLREMVDKDIGNHQDNYNMLITCSPVFLPT